MPSWHMELNSALFGTTLPLAPSPRLFASMVIGKSTFLLVFLCHSLPRSFSSKLGEENALLKKYGSPPQPLWRQWDTITEANSGQQVGLDDDEASIADLSAITDNICGACRSRESKTWWKAPKGLSTDVLCDPCGVNWRKYADLNVRPLREESLLSGKVKLSEKGEGTPLIGMSLKRVRASRISILELFPQAHFP